MRSVMAVPAPASPWAARRSRGCARSIAPPRLQRMSAVSDRDTQSFEAHRRALTGLAYRMLGSRAEAEDVVQDAYLRWHEADHVAIEEPRRYLGTIVTRLCLDRMKSARA